MVSDLDENPLFAGIEQRYMTHLRPLFVRVSCIKGTEVIRQDGLAEFLYIVEEGKASITYKPYDGEPITLSHVGKGGLFGWSALVGSRYYTSSAMVVEDMDAVRLRGSDLRKFCAEHPEAGQVILDRLANAVSARWKDAHAQVRAMLENGMKE